MDNVNTQPPKINRRSLIAAIPAAGLVATAATAPAYQFPNDVDLLPQLWAQFEKANEDWCKASGLPGNGNFDTPEMLEIEARKDALEAEICDTPVRSIEGAKAKLEFINRELSMEVVWDQHPKLMNDVINFLGGAA